MQFKKTEGGYIIRLLKGEKIIENLTEFCRNENIKSGIVSGIGGASEITLGYYNLGTQEYQWQEFAGIHEIVSMNGNVSQVDGGPFLHLHSVISNENFQTFGGHLKEATVGATCEIFLKSIDTPLERKLDEEIGLKLLRLED